MLKNNDQKKVVDKVMVTGYAVVPPASFIHSTEGLTPGFGSSVQVLPRRLKRFTCRSGEHAFTASQLAFDMADISPADLGERFGLYTNQAGQQHSDIDDYHAAFTNCSTPDASALASLWDSKDVDPFLAIKALSNNLLGSVSVHWSIRGDCSAFVRDQAGAAMALNEAMFNLRHNYIDAALVLTAGTALDSFEKINQQHDDEHSVECGVECGAVALILQRQSTCHTQPMAEIFDMKSGYDVSDNTNRSPKKPAYQLAKKQDRLLTQIINEQYYCNPHEPRWGGVIYSLSQIIHAVKQQKNSTPIKVHSLDTSGFDAQLTVSVF
ncbi:MAG: hypothetical protein ACJAUP_001669 [Cellvibrionaceae bacterium]|jgi:hypothetical protein